MNKSIAIFDLDGTLIKGDSFFPFLVFAAGLPRTLAALAEAIVKLPFRKDAAQYGPRTFIKALLLKRLLAGKHADELAPAIEKLCRWRRWIEPTRQVLLDHHTKGHHILVATGGLNLYVPALLRDLPCDAILSTEIGIENGVMTGEMRNGNCVRKRKAELVAEYMVKNGPFEDSWGYGNFPHDTDMLNLVKHPTVI